MLVQYLRGWNRETLATCQLLGDFFPAKNTNLLFSEIISIIIIKNKIINKNKFIIIYCLSDSIIDPSILAWEILGCSWSTI